jgi:Fe-S-cluster-containing hydrogenase component 2
LEQDEPPFIDTSRCYGCHLCITACPHEAIVLDSQNPTSIEAEMAL